MFFENINYITVVIAAIASMGVGFLWYSQAIFGKRWMKEMNHTPESIEELKKTNSAPGMAKTYSIMALFSIVTAVIIAAFINSLVFTGLGGLVVLAFCLWLGFSMPVALNHVLFGKDTVVLFAINSGYQLVALVVSTLIIGIFG